MDVAMEVVVVFVIMLIVIAVLLAVSISLGGQELDWLRGFRQAIEQFTQSVGS